MRDNQSRSVSEFRISAGAMYEYGNPRLQQDYITVNVVDLLKSVNSSHSRHRCRTQALPLIDLGPGDPQ
jgi:hypothetical protein